MSNRTAIIASVFIAGYASIFSISSISVAMAQAAAEETAQTAGEETPSATTDECLTAPKATAPAGAHWYYRSHKSTGRKCWYLADKGAKVKKAAETTSAPVANEDSPPPKKNPMQKSVANARAELTTDSTNDDSALTTSTWPPLPSSADTTVRDDNPTAAIQTPAPQPAAPQGWNIASRWPEPGSAASADNPSNTTAPEPAQQPAPALTPDRLALAAASTPTPAATSAALVQRESAAKAADPSSGDSTFSLRVLLSVLVCALALAAIIGPMIFKYVRPRPQAKKRADGPRRPIWDMDITRETVRQDNPQLAPHDPYVDPLPEPRVLDEAVDELEQLLVRASKRSAA